MKIQNETNRYLQFEKKNITDAGKEESEKETGINNQKAGISKESGVVFAGDLNLIQDPVEDKKKQARDMAMKLMEDVFANEKAVDEDLDNRRQHVDDLMNENEEHMEVIKGIEKQKEDMRQGYGMDENSQEEQDLKLLEKEAKSKHNPAISLSREERQQLKEIHEKGLTGYQKEMLQLDENAYEYEKKIEENQGQMIEEYAVIRGVRIERLKQHDMVDAVKAGEAIKQGAQKEIIGMIAEEGRQAQDEELETKKEEAEEKKEEAEELEEKIEEAREHREEQIKKREDDHEEMYELDSLMQDIDEKVANSKLPDAQKSMTQVVNELMLTLDDIKGLAVDEQA